MFGVARIFAVIIWYRNWRHSHERRREVEKDLAAAQACFAPLLEEEVRVCDLRGDRDEEKVGAVAANDDGRTNLAAGKVRERDRQQDDIISRAGY